MGSVQVDWAAIRKVPPGSYGTPRDYCESCGLYIWSEGGLKIPGLGGRYCKVRCVECALFGPGRCRWCGAKLEGAGKFCGDACRKQSEATWFGDGTRLLNFLSRFQPSRYKRVLQGEATCLVCGDPLAEKRDGARFCSDRCKVAYSRKSRTSPKTGIIRNTPQQNQQVTDQEKREAMTVPPDTSWSSQHGFPCSGEPAGEEGNEGKAETKA